MNFMVPQIQNLQEIQSTAFGSCTSLEKLVLPNSVKIIGDYVFAGCDNLKTITYKNRNFTLQDFTRDKP